MPQSATVNSLARAHSMMKEMQAQGVEWPQDYRHQAAQALREMLEGQMVAGVSHHLERMARRGEPDRRNGAYRRWLLTEMGEIELCVPRTRTFSAQNVVRAYARRAAHIDRTILACFVLGLSTRKVAKALLPILGRPVSASTVSRVARGLDESVRAFHRRPLRGRYRALVFDGVVMSRKSGAGALRRPVLVALGLHHDGRKEVIDFRLASAESAAQWERFLTDLYRRGLTAKDCDMVCVDGGSGLLAAVEMVYHDLPVQRCWAHKMRNVLDKVRKAEREAAKAALRRVLNAPTERQARTAAGRFAQRFEAAYPKAVACLRNDLDELLTCWLYDSVELRKAVRTTNAIERRFREVRRRTRPMGAFDNRTSLERILFAVFTHENSSQGIPLLFPLTQNI